MKRATLVLLVVAAAAGVTAAAVPAKSDATPTLQGTVGPGFTISLRRNGQRVTRLAPGTYRFVVTDRSRFHNFEIGKSGGASERALTSVPFVGTRTTTVRLTSGEWEFECEPHKRTMHGDFTVGTGAAPTTADDDDGRSSGKGRSGGDDD
jgi:hypothetical protein